TAGLLPPDRGRITLGGTPIDGPDPRIGLVFQEPRLLPWRSAADNVTYPLQLAGWWPERRAARLPQPTELVGPDPAAPGVGAGDPPGPPPRPRPGARARGAPPRRAVQRARRVDAGAVRPR